MRRARIARGSGTQVSDVNQLVTRFFEAAKMMQQMAKGGGMPGMPGAGGMPGMPGGPGKRAGARQPKQVKGKKGKRVSGNPAKRAAAAQGTPVDQTPAEFELPKELRDLL